MDELARQSGEGIQARTVKPGHPSALAAQSDTETFNNASIGMGTMSPASRRGQRMNSVADLAKAFK